jgi:hypothetical protein
VDAPHPAGRVAGPDPLAGVRLKLGRARRHIQDLVSALESFYSSEPYKHGTRRDPATGRVEVYITEVATAPDDILLIVGDALHALRSALDHLAMQLFLAGARGPSATEDELYDVSFPVAGNRKGYEKQRDRKLRGVAAGVLRELDGLEPYRGGNGHALWSLNRLDNIDKHRLLITVCSGFRSINVGRPMLARLKNVWKEAHGEELGVPLDALDAFLRSSEPQVPMKVGDVIFSDPTGEEPIGHYQFRCHLIVWEPPAADGENPIELCHRMLVEVEKVVERFTPLLTDSEP